MVGLVGDSRLARAQQGNRRHRPGGGAAPLTIPAGTAGRPPKSRRASAPAPCQVAAHLGRQPELAARQPRRRRRGGPARPRAPRLRARLDRGALPATPFDASAAPALCQRADAGHPGRGAAASVGTAAAAAATTRMLRPGGDGDARRRRNAAVSQDSTAAPEPAPGPAPGASSPAFDGKGGADARRVVGSCGAAAWRTAKAGRRRRRGRAAAPPSGRLPWRPAGAGAAGAAATPGHGARHRRRRSRRRRRDLDRRRGPRALRLGMHRWRRWAPRSATAARRSTGGGDAAVLRQGRVLRWRRLREHRRSRARRVAGAVPPSPSAPPPPLPPPRDPPSPRSARRRCAVARRSAAARRRRPLPNRSVLRRWGNCDGPHLRRVAGTPTRSREEGLHRRLTMPVAAVT